MNKFWLFLFTLVPVSFHASQADSDTPAEKPIVIVIASYNNATWYKHNLDSVFAQQYSNYRVVYCDDCSTDGTYDLVREYVTECHQEHRVTILSNEQNYGVLFNMYQAIHSCKENEVIVILDGDDWLAHNHVLQRVNKEYADPNVWMTYGQYEDYPGGTVGQAKQLPLGVIMRGAYREYDWVTSHLRTFYAGLFKKIAIKDMLTEGRFFKVTADFAMMFPLLEMVGVHGRFIPDILHTYNVATPNNDHKLRVLEQIHYDHYIRGLKKYAPLVDFQPTGEQSQQMPVDILLFDRGDEVRRYECLNHIKNNVTGYGRICLMQVDVNDLFKDGCVQHMSCGKSDYIMLVDIMADMPQSLDLYRCSQSLRKTQGYVFFANRMGRMLKDNDHINAYVPLPDGVCIWQFCHGAFEWRKPHSMEWAIYKKSDLEELFKAIDFTDFDSLCAAWNFAHFDLDAVGICFL